MFGGIYKNKKVFLTGHTGFKGSWLALWLTKLGAKVCGYSLSVNTSPSMYSNLNIENKIYKSVIGDILDRDHLRKIINEFQPDIIFHLAAQSIVKRSYIDPILTYETNLIGSLNMLVIANQCPSVKAFINVTTDKCYENKEILRCYKEDDPMGGYDMYSSSKACVEILSSSFRRCFLQYGYALATVRSGNVIGGGDWALDRLIPDCIRAINCNNDIKIRNPKAVRPWQHVLDALSGYLLLGQKLLFDNKKYSDSFNFGPKEDSILTVLNVVEKIINLYQKGSNILIDRFSKYHEAKLLMLDITKANEVLGWYPTYSADIAIEKTIEWYKNFYLKDTDMYDFTIKQIVDFEESIKWNKN